MISEGPIICYLPMEGGLPTKYDLKIAEWLSRKIRDVSEVIVVVGNNKGDKFTTDQKKDVWDTYLQNNNIYPISVRVDKEYSPLAHIYKNQEKHAEDPFSIALPEKIAKNKTFQEHFEVFPNYQILITPTYDRTSSAKMAEAINTGDFREFIRYVPTEMSLEKKKALFDSFKKNSSNDSEVFTESYWDSVLTPLYNKYHIK